ncbi:hypothetical protein H5P28_04885 [Ruficoccus amylovorans]|uniref:Glucoamylase (Glucan-1,4-alpha-glucosidase), GH15 family n=1 Tax=Ruficoccus amylovorans TaxID=1804625 RepID=A0A842HAZ6_9BACT|nr:hypothetical protein [Ruficoccus amylovorans]MBC2593592.1 hypothetical protein [Ruficoccus amylovorans]
MNLLRWLPWRYFLRRATTRHGFLDPFAFMARLRQFSQPSEVQEPMELLRAGAAFHARGLINTKVIQNNLDWIWPYWIARQFNPRDVSFIPRAFSFSHINLTHRNWTAVGLPGEEALALVDPRGLVTPFHDGWSIDHWFVADDGRRVLPAYTAEAEQVLLMGDQHQVLTEVNTAVARLSLNTGITRKAGHPTLLTQAGLRAEADGWLVVAIRPSNPEGVRFVDEIAREGSTFTVNENHRLHLEHPPERVVMSDYHRGDVGRALADPHRLDTAQTCPAGLASAAAAWRVRAHEVFTTSYQIPLEATEHRRTVAFPNWESFNRQRTKLEIPDTRMREVFESSQHTLALLAEPEIVPGPYTYRRFWFRDACLMANAFLGNNDAETVRRTLATFTDRQRHDGYFHSQEGEWDSNGQVLWIVDRWEQLTGQQLDAPDHKSLLNAARWIVRKRKSSDSKHPGLFPAGFSAEHLGPNDYYYWDDFWGIAGLRCAAAIFARRGENALADEFRREATAFEKDLRANIEALPERRTHGGIPASPHRRMDSGAVGSMVVDYPLEQTFLPDERITRTANWLWQHCFLEDAFFQDMIHSGLNIYLSLALAQTFLRRGDERCRRIVKACTRLASPTGKWPEAVHPRTLGGCMGDGEHGWAAAEWCEMMRALFIRESEDGLILGEGLFPEWFEADEPMAYGPTLTRFGPVTLELEPLDGQWQLRILGEWRDKAPRLQVRIPGFTGQDLPGGTKALILSRNYTSPTGQTSPAQTAR